MEMLEEAERERIGCPLTPEKPLVRLRVRCLRLHKRRKNDKAE